MYACLAGASAGRRCRCPNQAKRLRLMSVLQGSNLQVLYSSELVICLFLIIWRKKFLWNVSMRLAVDIERDRISELYRNIDDTSATNIRILTDKDILAEQRTDLFVLKAAHAFCPPPNEVQGELRNSLRSYVRRV